MPPKKPCAFLYPELLGPHFRLIYAYYGLKLHFKNMKTTININLMTIMPKRNLKMSWGGNILSRPSPEPQNLFV